MQIKKKINEKQLIVDWSVWTNKLTIEYENETIHESWEITVWILFEEIIILLLGIYIGILFF